MRRPVYEGRFREASCKWDRARRLRADDAVSTRAVSGLRPHGHYEPAARSSLTGSANVSCEARPGAE